MEILLWLVPPVVVTVVAMLWVGWVGRERREIDRDEAVRRLGAALDQEPKPLPGRPRARRERSTGVALRRTPRRPTALPVEPPVDPLVDPLVEPAVEPGRTEPGTDGRSGEQRRAS